MATLAKHFFLDQLMPLSQEAERLALVKANEMRYNSHVSLSAKMLGRLAP